MCEFVGMGAECESRVGVLVAVAELLVRDYLPEIRAQGEAVVEELDSMVVQAFDSCREDSALRYLRAAAPGRPE